MTDVDALCYAATRDFAAVRAEDLPVFASAFLAFADAYEARLGVLHLRAMAATLTRIGIESALSGSRGVCWNATSLADTFAAGVVDGEDRRLYHFDRDSRHHWVGIDYPRSELAPTT